MKNDFTQKTRDLFDMGGWCMDWEDGRNDADCIHHILGRCSNSAYNAAPLNNFRNHQPEGRKGLLPLSSQTVRSKYLQKTKEYLESIDYKPTQQDLQFLETYKEYYVPIKTEASF